MSATERAGGDGKQKQRVLTSLGSSLHRFSGLSSEAE